MDKWEHFNVVENTHWSERGATCTGGGSWRAHTPKPNLRARQRRHILYTTQQCASKTYKTWDIQQMYSDVNSVCTVVRGLVSRLHTALTWLQWGRSAESHVNTAWSYIPHGNLLLQYCNHITTCCVQCVLGAIDLKTTAVSYKVEHNRYSFTHSWLCNCKDQVLCFPRLKQLFNLLQHITLQHRQVKAPQVHRH